MTFECTYPHCAQLYGGCGCFRQVKKRKGKKAMDEKDIRHRCFMDGIDWQHHLADDSGGTELFPDEESLREKKTCLSGGCGVVEVEVRLIRWVEKQDLKYDAAPPRS